MKQLFILLLLINTTDPSEISRYNKLKNRAEVAFEHGQYDVAIQNYSMLYDTLGADDPAIALNLAHSYYATGDSANATLKYQASASSNNQKLKSIAYQQLGVMADKPETLSQALQYLKSALKADPTNEEARFNYEVIKKKLERQKDQKNQDKNNKDDIEPSEYAKEMKAKADALRSNGLFKQAYATMQEALSKDETTQAFKDYIERLSKVAGI